MLKVTENCVGDVYALRNVLNSTPSISRTANGTQTLWTILESLLFNQLTDKSQADATTK